MKSPLVLVRRVAENEQTLEDADSIVLTFADTSPANLIRRYVLSY